MVTRKKCTCKIACRTGFFAFYNMAVMLIGYCLEHGHVPHFDLCDFIYKRSGTEDPWSSFFDPLELYDGEYTLQGNVEFKFSYTDGIPIRCENDPSYDLLCLLPNNFSTDEETRLKLNKLSKYIKVRQDIINKAEEFKKKHFYGRTVTGVHIRHTDHREEIIPYAKGQTAYHHIGDYVKSILRHSSSDVIFIATDDTRTLKSLKFVRDIRDKIVFIDASRSSTRYGLHRELDNNGFDPIQIGEDVLTDTLLLSSCDKLIGSYSNITLTALFWNPYLPFTNISL